MYTLKVDPARNRFELRVSGRLDLSELDRITSDVHGQVARVRPGFVAAVDLRGMIVLDAAGAERMKEVQETLVRAKPAKVGTLLDGAVLQLQLQRVGRQAGIDAIAQRFSDEGAWRAFVG